MLLGQPIGCPIRKLWGEALNAAVAHQTAINYAPTPVVVRPATPCCATAAPGLKLAPFAELTGRLSGDSSGGCTLSPRALEPGGPLRGKSVLGSFKVSGME